MKPFKHFERESSKRGGSFLLVAAWAKVSLPRAMNIRGTNVANCLSFCSVGREKNIANHDNFFNAVEKNELVAVYAVRRKQVGVVLSTLGWGGGGTSLRLATLDRLICSKRSIISVNVGHILGAASCVPYQERY